MGKLSFLLILTICKILSLNSCMHKSADELIARKWLYVSTENFDKLRSVAISQGDTTFLSRMEHDMKTLTWQFNRDKTYEKRNIDRVTSTGTYEITKDGKKLITTNMASGGVNTYLIYKLSRDSLVTVATADSIPLIIHMKAQ